MKKLHLLKTILLLCALIVGSGTMWADDYEQLTSIANIDESAEYVLGVSGTGFHYEGTSSWGKTALPSAQTPIKYTLKKADDGKSFTAKTKISSTTYYLQIPTSNTFSMSTSVGTNTDIIIGTTQVSGTNYAVANKSTTTRHLRINGSSGLRSYAGTTGTMAFFYKVIPAFTLTATSNNNSYGTVSVTNNVITASPLSGYRVSSSTPYTITAGSTNVTNISQNGNVFTVTATGNCSVQINFEVIPAYTVTFNAEGGTCGTSSLTEALGGQGVTLPAATCSKAGWVLAGWATSAQDETSTRPTLYKAGSTYKPSANITLHAVYTLDYYDPTKFVRVTSIADLEWAKAVAVVYLHESTSYILNHNRETEVAPPTETSSKITPTANTIFALSGDNTEGYTLTCSNGTLGVSNSLPTSGSKAASWTTSNNKWILEAHNDTPNLFVLRNANGTYVTLAYNSGWKAYYVKSYVDNQYTSMRLYVPETYYDSNPSSAVITPSVAFTSTSTTTLYLDGTTTYDNCAEVTGVAKSITYSSSNTDVATVDSDGKVTAVGIGTTTITASVAPELKVNKGASDTYNLVVKSATTISGIKSLSSDATVVDFSADLTDAVVTYVNGNYAYIQDASAAIMVNVSGHGLTAGKKINGAVSGKVKAPNTIDQISAIDVSKATITDAEVPAAQTKTLAHIVANAASLDGKKVTVNAATVSTGMNNATSGGVITDDDGTTSMSIVAPNKLTLNATEIGNFTGFVSTKVENETPTYQLNIYETSQYVKTQNVATDQTLTFANADVQLDEVTDALTAYTGQVVSGAYTTVTWSKEDESSIIGDFNTTTGALTLTGACGTATITATAAAENIVEAGVTTPYNEAEESYTITVNPRYIVTFSVNGVETTVRQASSGAAVAVPTPDDMGDYTLVGWSTSTVAPTDTKPSLASIGASITPADNNGKYYAVFAQGEVTGNAGSYELDYTDDSVEPDGYGNTVNVTATDGSSWVVKAYKNSGMQINTGKDSSIKIPTCPSNISTIVLTTTSTAKKEAGFSSSDYSGSGTITYVASSGSDATSQTINLSGKSVKAGYIVPKGGNVVITNIVVNYEAIVSYSDYRTSLPQVEVTIPESKYLSFCYGSKLDFSGTSVKAYKAAVDGEGKVTLTKVDVVPANEGVILYCGTADTYSIPVTDKTASDVTGNAMKGVLTRTQVVWNPTTDVYNYILQAGNFNKATNGYLKPNRAYLQTSYNVTAAGARELVIAFDDEDSNTTSITEVRGKMEGANYYDLSGRKVAQPTKKGLYIVNGRKVVVK